MEPALISGFCSVKRMRVWLPLDGAQLAPSRRWYSFTYSGRMVSWVGLGWKEGCTNIQISAEPRIELGGPCGRKAEILQRIFKIDSKILPDDTEVRAAFTSEASLSLSPWLTSWVDSASNVELAMPRISSWNSLYLGKSTRGNQLFLLPWRHPLGPISIMIWPMSAWSKPAMD